MPRPIEIHAHDPQRYINDMLAWVHQVGTTGRPALACSGPFFINLGAAKVAKLPPCLFRPWWLCGQREACRCPTLRRPSPRRGSSWWRFSARSPQAQRRQASSWQVRMGRGGWTGSSLNVARGRCLLCAVVPGLDVQGIRRLHGRHLRFTLKGICPACPNSQACIIDACVLISTCGTRRTCAYTSDTLNGADALNTPALLDRIFDSICRPLKLRVEQVWMQCVGPMALIQSP